MKSLKIKPANKMFATNNKTYVILSFDKETAWTDVL